MEKLIKLVDNKYYDCCNNKFLVCDIKGKYMETNENLDELEEYARTLGYHIPERIERILYDRFEISEKVREIASKINEDYKDIKEPLIIVGILKGGFMYMSDLVRQLTIPHVIDFMAVSSYGEGKTSDGNVRIVMDCRINQKGKDVLIVEDIVDSGYTLKYLTDNFKARGVNSIKTTTLLDKPSGRKTDFAVDYPGYVLETDDWIVGYGLDLNEKWRTLPYIGILKKE